MRTVAQDLKVKLLSDHAHSDSEIAVAVQSALRWSVFIPRTITARVHEGSITLEGMATWNDQRDAADHAVRYLKGVVGVHNYVTLKPVKARAAAKKTKAEGSAQLGLLGDKPGKP